MIDILKDKLQFFYHSGTGNTFLVVQKMVEIFEKNGIEVNLYKIENTNPKKINKDKNKRKVEEGLLEVEKYALSILEGKTKWKRIPLLSDFFNFLVSNKFVMNNINLSMGKRINVDLNKCVNCGLCAKLCPVNNIKINNKTPIFGNDCELCTRCLNFCPSNAIKISNKSFKQYKAVNPNKLMKGEQK